MKFKIDTEAKTIVLYEPTSLKEFYKITKEMFPTTWDLFTIVKEDVPKTSLFDHILTDNRKYDRYLSPPNNGVYSILNTNCR